MSGAVIALALLPALTSAGDSYDCRVQPQFSGQGSIGKSVRAAIGQSKERLTIALYGFDNFDLVAELLDLAKRKVSVRVKIDSARSSGKKIVKVIDQLRAGGVEVQTVAPGGRNHNKFAASPHRFVQLDAQSGIQLGKSADPGLSRVGQSVRARMGKNPLIGSLEVIGVLDKPGIKTHQPLIVPDRNALVVAVVALGILRPEGDR
jgi:hypothetical protein